MRLLCATIQPTTQQIITTSRRVVAHDDRDFETGECPNGGERVQILLELQSNLLTLGSSYALVLQSWCYCHRSVVGVGVETGDERLCGPTVYE